MSYRNRTLFILFACHVVLGKPVSADSEWIELFDGRTTQGWVMNADEGACRVIDGLLRLQATDPNNRGHLFYVGDDGELDLFRNFELEVVARGEAKANSGIFFHTDMETRDEVLHLANGYEVQLHLDPAAKQQTGSLYDVVPLTVSPAKPDQWFTVRIRVEGKSIRVWLDDIEVINYTEPENVLENRSKKRKGRILREEGGAIALQAHDEKSVFSFRSVRLRRLKTED